MDAIDFRVFLSGLEIVNACWLQVFLEQKKMLKTGLNIARFRQHIPIIEAETVDYFKRWGEQGQRGNFVNILVKYDNFNETK